MKTAPIEADALLLQGGCSIVQTMAVGAICRVINMKSSARTRVLSICAAALPMALILPGRADAQADFSDADAAPVIEEVVVVGTRIPKKLDEVSAPVTLISSNELEERGYINIVDALDELPLTALTANNRSTAGNRARAGTSVANLRGLSSSSGSSRTLTLVNGRRHVAGQPGTTNVDVSTIPSALVERIEIVSGGSSAIYGSDAVAGVINYVLKKDFDGFEASAQFGGAGQGDLDSRRISALWGRDFDRGNVVLGFHYSDEGAAWVRERDYLWGLDSLGADGTPIPDSRNSRTAYGGLLFAPFATPAGVFNVPFQDFLGLVTGVPLAQITFDAGGQPVVFDPGTMIGANASGGDGIPLAHHAASAAALSAPVESWTVNLNGEWLLGEPAGWLGETRAFVEYKVSNTLAASTGAVFSPGAFDALPLSLGADNPFLHPGIVTTMAVLGLPRLVVARDFSDLGPAQSENESDTWRAVAGLRGNKGSHRWELYANFGKTERASQVADLNQARFAQAVDAVSRGGGIQCRNPAGGCVPINILGTQVDYPQTFRDFVGAPWAIEEKVEQSVLGLSATGDLFDFFGRLPRYAAGIEYREESTVATPNAVAAAGGAALSPFPVDGIDGRFDVVETFAELSLPLIQDAAGNALLQVDASGRYGDYSTVGGVFSWKAGILFSPIPDLRIRATYGTAARAPNLVETARLERTAPVAIGDFCSPLNFPNYGPDRAANCAEIAARARAAFDQGLIPIGVYFPAELFGLPGDFFTASPNAVSVSGNNPSLREEEAETASIGVELTPGFAPGLQLSADYWDIEIVDAIELLTATEASSLCYDGPADGFPGPECGQIERDPATGLISRMHESFINLSGFRAAGIDLAARYAFDLGRGGLLDFSWLATRYTKFERVASSGAVTEGKGAESGVREFNHNLSARYAKGPFSVFLQRRYIDDAVATFRPGMPRLPSTAFYNASVTWAIGDRFWATLGGSNILDERPDTSLHDLLANSASFDQVGRIWFLAFQSRL